MSKQSGDIKAGKRDCVTTRWSDEVHVPKTGIACGVDVPPVQRHTQEACIADGGQTSVVAAVHVTALHSGRVKLHPVQAPI